MFFKNEKLTIAFALGYRTMCNTGRVMLQVISC